jgi:hypothetical protein
MIPVFFSSARMILSECHESLAQVIFALHVFIHIQTKQAQLGVVNTHL